MVEEKLEKELEAAAEETAEEDCVEVTQANTEEAEKQDSEENLEENQDGESAEEPKKGIFKKKKDKKDMQIEELTDKLKRQMAEFDNFRKRTEKEKSGMYEIGAKSVIENMLPVVDNFERGLEGVVEEQQEDPFVEGMKMIYKQILTVFEELEVKPIEAIGQEFNPDLHNAVMHVEDESVEENIVTEEFQKGYTYRESVVRHSMVKVAN